MTADRDSGEHRRATDHVAFDRLIPSDVREIEPIVEEVTRECRVLALSARQCALNVPVALTEALSNAILRGNRGVRDKQVRVRAVVSDSALVLEVADEGGGFDLDACTVDPTRPGNLEREDGRGLFLMRSLMDRVERYEADERNVVRLTLRRS
ncbi:MAG TPA: ATP-binding protein [Gemmatimonadaceae bacterium]